MARKKNEQTVKRAKRTTEKETLEIQVENPAPAIKSWKKWSDEEENILLEEIRKAPYNLKACFIAASKKLDRSVGAIGNHWYTVTSKNPKILELGTISSKHFCRNRKNGKGVPVTQSIWRRFVAMVKRLV